MKLTLLDGKQIEVSKGMNGFEVSKLLSPSLSKKVLAYRLNEKLYDLYTPINEEGTFLLITEQSEEALTILNHSASHLLAQAILNLYPKALIGFGPAILEGFYYDIDFPEVIVEDDLLKIEKEMMSLAKQNLLIKRINLTHQEALEKFKNNPYKIELIKEINEDVTIYEQGNFFDLCTGPHLPNTSFLKHFKLLSLAGAYWRGDHRNKQLTRIYGTAFYHRKDLEDHLHLLEERKKRDHRRIGKELGLFMISEYGPGFPFWLPNGMILRNELESYWYQKHTEHNYEFIKTPTLLSKELWLISGHYQNYKENMYFSEVDDKEYAIKPMNCPGSLLVYKNDLHSYKDLPLRVGELGLVHRKEASGALSGLFRVRAFTQDDAHIYCRQDQLLDEIVAMLKLFDEFYTLFGLSYHLELSTRPLEKYIGDIKTWDASEKALKEACLKVNKEFKINEGDGAFYGPKLDFKLKDAVGRIWQCGTIQLDMNLPERFELFYINEHGEKERPVMLHRAIYGSIERFIGILIEHFAGAFPTWLAPLQVSLLPVHHTLHLDYALKVEKQLKEHGVRVKVNNEEEKIGYRLRQAQVQKIPYTIVVGDNEVNEETVTYRLFGNPKQTTISLKDFIKLIINDIKNRQLSKKD